MENKTMNLQSKAIATLDLSVTLYVPSRFGPDQKVCLKTRDDIAGSYARRATDLFGGATVRPATGYYNADNGNRIVESVSTITIFYNDGDTDTIGQFIDSFVSHVRSFGQESVAVDINGTLHLLQ
jgi:hypothetical protein